MKHLWTVTESDTKIYANNWPNFIEACPKRDLIDQLNDSYLYSCISIMHKVVRIAVNTRLNNFRSNRRINSFEERSPLISIDLRHSNPLSIIDPD